MSEFFGRLHPLWVHLPTGLLVVSTLLGLFFFRGKWPSLRQTLLVLLGLGALGGWFSVVSGLSVAEQGSYAMGHLNWHKWLGISTTALASVLWVLLWRQIHRPLALQIINGGLLLCLMGAGHLGGSLTHGDGYLWEKAPGWVQQVAGYRPFSEPVLSVSATDTTPAYAQLIQPLLDAKCARCHHPKEKYGGLDLSSAEGLQAGGWGGRTLVAGQAAESQLFRRVSLPADHPKFMPTSGPAFTSDQVRLLEGWIATGASFELTVKDLPMSKEIETLLSSRFGWVSVAADPLASLVLPAVEDVDLQEFEGKNLLVKRIFAGSNALEVSPAKSGVRLSRDDLETLRPVAANVVWLHLGGTGLGNEDLGILAEMPHLMKLRLDRTGVSSGFLPQLTHLKSLQSLNLYGTEVGDSGWEVLSQLPALKDVTVSASKVSEATVARLQAQYPQVKLN